MRILWFFLFARATAQTCNYCDITPQHDLCLYSGVGSSCTGLTINTVSSAEIQTILQQHNTLRANVSNGYERQGSPGPQPSASNMQVMTWSTELAQIAQMWANQCQFQHDCNSCRATCQFSVGQNLYTEGTTAQVSSANWVKAIRGWYNEVKYFNPANIKPFRSTSRTGHYTAIVWASTKFIGCGYTLYESDDYNTGLYVCNYGPAGNRIGGEMYSIGSPCSKCPTGTSCSSTYKGLCGAATQLVGAFAPESGLTPTKPIALPGFFEFLCKVGDKECELYSSGCSWVTLPTTRPDSRATNYLETSISSGNFAELTIKDFITPSPDQPLCFTFQIFKQIIPSSFNSFFQFLLAQSNPILITIGTANALPVVVPLPDTSGNLKQGWFEARLTFKGINQPFQITIKQNGPIPIGGDRSSVIRLGIESVQVTAGKCEPLIC